jgi:hypothetical protein
LSNGVNTLCATFAHPNQPYINGRSPLARHSASSTVATACTVTAIRTAAAQRIEIGFRTGVFRR